MIVTLPAGELNAALKKIGAVIEKRNTIPILSNVLLRADGQSLTLTATDLDIMITASIPATVEVPGAITVDAGLLEAYSGKLKKEAPIALDVDKQQHPRLICAQGRSRSALNTLPEGDFPDFDYSEHTDAFSMDGKALLELLNAVRFAISTEETRYYLNGVYFHPKRAGDKRVVAAVTTDGHRLALMSTTAADGQEPPEFTPVIIPRKTILLLQRLLDGAGLVHVAISSSKIRFTIDKTIIASKLIDGSYPDYERVIPNTNSFATIGRGQLADVIDRVHTVAKEKSSAVRLQFEGANLKASVREADTGEASEDMDVSYEGPPMLLGINAKYLRECLNSLDSDQINMGLIDPGSPVIIKVPAVDNRLVVVMPMRA